MKNLYLLAFLLIISCKKEKSETLTANQEPIAMLNEFYSNYSSIMFTIDEKSKFDALVEKYCTEELQQEAKRIYDMGFDLLTDEWGICEQDLKSLKITKSPLEDGIYIVSYTTDTNPVTPDITVKKKVTLNINVIKEDGTYKINSVKGADTH